MVLVPGGVQPSWQSFNIRQWSAHSTMYNAARLEREHFPNRRIIGGRHLSRQSIKTDKGFDCRFEPLNENKVAHCVGFSIKLVHSAGPPGILLLRSLSAVTQADRSGLGYIRGVAPALWP